MRNRMFVVVTFAIALAVMLILGGAALVWFDAHGGHGRGSAQDFLDSYYEQTGP